MLKYKRVLLKLTGESMVGKGKTGIDFEFVSFGTWHQKLLKTTPVQLAIVNGGGNIFRGRTRGQKVIRSDRLYWDAWYRYECISSRS